MITKHGPALATFISDSRGATALLFAIVAVPVLLGAAFVIDYSRATNTRAALDAAADAAALAAAKVAGEKVQGAIFADKDKDKALADAKAIGEATFRSIAAQKVSPVGDPSVQVKLVKGGVSATVSYEHANQNAFAGVFDKTAIDLRGSATASFSFAPYIDIYVLLDTSNSMGLGATLAAQQQMQQKIGCIFGCHVAGSNAYQATKNLGIPMRVDVLRGALEKMLETAVSATAGLKGNQLRVGVYTFSNKFEKLAPLTASLKNTQQKTATVALSSDGGGTNFHVALKGIADEMKEVGDGSSPSKPRVYVFLITDGVEDSAKWSGSDWVWDWSTTAPYGPDWGVRPLDPAMCATLKDRGATVSVLHTTYVTFNPITEDRERNLNTNILPKLPSALQACSSGRGNFLQADQPSEIESAIQTMFSAAIAPLRLSQ